MKEIHEAVKALESDIGFWRPSWILLKKLKNAKKNYRANSLGGEIINCRKLWRTEFRDKSLGAARKKVFMIFLKSIWNTWERTKLIT